MYIPTQIDIEYLIDAAETISTDKDIPKYISYRLFREAQQRLLIFGPDENAARLHDRISQGFVLLEEDQECPKKYEKMSLIEILVDIYGEYYDAKNENDGVEGSSETRERFLTTSKVLRTALRMLIRVERGDTSEEDFIRENRIPEEIVQNTKYDEDSYNESSSTAAATDLQASRVNTELRRSYGFQANMNFPSKIEIEYLIDAAEKASFERDIEEYIPYRLFEEARETLERFKNDQTSLIGHAENTADLEDRIDKGLKRLTYEGKKIPECPEGYTENESVIQVLVKFYQRYNKKKKIDKLHNEDENHKKWGFLSRNFQVLEGRSAMRERILTTSKALRIALKMLCRVERGDTSEEVFIQENEIPNEDTEYDEEGSNETYNIIPFDDRPDLLPEVKRAIASLKWGIEDFPPRTRGHDVLDCLQKCFGFQESSVSNQRENIVNLLSNEQMRPFTPGEHGTALEAALEKVFSRTLDNYTKWCSYLSIKSIWENTDENATGEDENVISKDKKILYISLYYLIWGEAANVRFLPECLCYIFHRMSEQLDKYLKLNGGSSIEQVPQPLYEGSFIDQVIQPLYEVIAAEAKIKKEMNVPHSKWRNYDDFNEYFWSRDCLQLGWPLERNSPFFRKPLKGSTVFGKTSFVEHRTFWHLYHSFHRMWIFHVMMFQALVIFAFNDEKLNTKTLRGILTVGPTYFVMKLFQSMFDIGLKYGAYSNTSDSKKSHLLFRFIWFIVATAFICFLCMKCLQEMTSSIEESMGFIIYITILGIYAVFKILFSYLSKKYENSSVAGLISWIYQEEYVGRGMDEKPTDYKYMIFWLVTLAINIAYTYHYLVSPLVRPTRDITDVSKNIHNMLAIGSLWAGVICAYIVGSHVSYNVTSAVVGTFVGHKDGLGNIKFLGDVHKCFDKIPTAFMNHSRESPLENNQEDVKKLDAAEFSPFWNQIVMNLREEDYISDSEQYTLSMPEKSGCIDVIQWPFFLLAGKVSLAIKIAAKSVPQKDMWDEISRDAYMKYAVEECFHSVKFILKSVSDNEGRAWVHRIYERIKKSIEDDRNLGSEFQLKQLESFVKAISELTEMLTMQKDLKKRLKNNAKKLLNNVIQHNFLGKAGSQISDVNWPTDPELWSQIERLHLLLTMDKSADRVPRNPEARRRLEFFTNSLFMLMPTAKPVPKMLSFSVLTPYYEETVIYSLDELETRNDDGVKLIDYLKNLYPDEWTNYCERHEGYTDVEGDEYELRLWASYRGQTLARTVRGTMYYQKALLLQAYREMLIAVGLGEDGLTSTSPVPDVSMDEDTQATLNTLEERSSRGELLVQTSGTMLRDKENYNPWREQMMAMLKSEINMTGFVDGSLRDPDPKGESQVKYVRNYSQKWKKLDKKVKDWIMASLNDTLKNMVKEMKTTKELWETLEMFFSTDTDEISSVNVTEHVSIKLLNKDHYRGWVSQMEKFLQEKGMIGYINGKLKDPDPEGKSQVQHVRIYSQQWKKLDRQVTEFISDSLSESMYGSVKDSETAEQMWDALKEIIRSQCLDSAKAHVDLKFTYVVSCQIYGKQKREGKDVAADIAFLLKKNEGLRVAYIDKNEENNKKEFYSKLVKADKNGKETIVYYIKLPGDPRLGEGKPENQNHAIVFTRGNAIQTIDMNQDNYFEETLKMRNLLEEFHSEHGIPPPTILGIREHIFTGSASYLASFMSNQETSFVTLGQRVMAKPLNVRMHYGHSDVFDRVFHITRGGISKASRGINISEDIYAGFNSTLRNGRVTHHEYIQVGKGRDVGFNQIAIFEGKVAGGNGEQVLSRDIYRLGQRFDFFRMLSFYYTSVGYYFSSLLMVITLYILLYGNLIMALSGTRVPHVLNDTNLTIWWLLLIVLLPAIYMVLVQYIEQGLEKAVECFLAMFFKLCSIFFAFSLGTRIHWFGRTIIHGGASYQATGRGFVLHHITFSENYRLYSRSHFVKGMEVLFLLVVYCIHGFHPAHAFYNNLLLLGGLILSISWIVAPFLFDSSPFDPNKNLEDWEDWNNWRNCKSVPVEESVAVEEHVPVDETVRAKKSVPVEEHVPVKQSVAVEEHVPVKQSVAIEEHAPIEESVTVEKSWEAWWNKELSHIRTFEGRVIETILSLRFFIFPYVVGYKLDMQGLWICGAFWLAFVLILFVLEVLSNKNLHHNRVLATIGALAIAFFTSAYVRYSMFYNECYTVNVGDMLAFIIAFIATLWGILSICVAWKPMLKRFNYLWKLVKSLAWICDAGMGTLIFSIAPMLSRRTIKQYLVRNMSDQNVSEYLQTTPAETAILYGRAF